MILAQAPFQALARIHRNTNSEEVVYKDANEHFKIVDVERQMNMYENRMYSTVKNVRRLAVGFLALADSSRSSIVLSNASN